MNLWQDFMRGQSPLVQSGGYSPDEIAAKDNLSSMIDSYGRSLGTPAWQMPQQQGTGWKPGESLAQRNQRLTPAGMSYSNPAKGIGMGSVPSKPAIPAAGAANMSGQLNLSPKQIAGGSLPTRQFSNLGTGAFGKGSTGSAVPNTNNSMYEYVR